jgi:hypothetical protein
MIDNLAAPAAWEALGINRGQMFVEQLVRPSRLILARPGIFPYLAVREISTRQTQ